ncbi:MAG TPA: hypothetical protein VMB81_17520 [Candidatus Sulfotelmatobacter sp.]|nr:hypothetical protein [Candidatus Sulfotelmatobacter sp.]
MKASITQAEFATLVKRAGLSLTDQQRAALYEGYGYIEEMIERVRTPRGREAEPAHIFVFPPSLTKVP